MYTSKERHEDHPQKAAANNSTSGALSLPAVPLTNQVSPLQLQQSNTTGLPDHLKSGIENLSGHSMDDVKVHYNSHKTAPLQAHAFAQGTDIHIGSGQEKHLAHEAWHVVQQKQGRVKPTLQLKGSINVNDDASLEKEADIMGSKALSHQAPAVPLSPLKVSQPVVQRQRINSIVTGTTHLVQALNGSIYQGTQGRLLPNNTRIEVETSDKIRSRRGPNQESFREYDAQNAPEYRWVRVISVEGEPQAPGTYIRDDTFVGGADIPRGSAFVPALDHRERTQPNLPERTFAPIHAAQWYQRPLGHDKSSTADRKHTKLLSVAFDVSAAHIGAAMRHHAKDSDTGIVLEAIGQHFSHVTPWTADNIESQGRDRHPGHLKGGEYYRTSPGHPLHKDFQSHQQLLGIHKKDVTTEPINPGWGDIAERVMGVDTMKDVVKKGPMGTSYRESQSPGRFARGPGAAIGHEEMARETARMRHALLGGMDPRFFDGVDEQIGKINTELEYLTRRATPLSERLPKVKAALEQHAAAKVALKKQIAIVTGRLNKAAAAKAKAEKTPTADDQAAAKAQAEVLPQSAVPSELDDLTARREQVLKDEAGDSEEFEKLTAELSRIQKVKKDLTNQLEPLLNKKAFYLQRPEQPVTGPLAAPLQKPRVTDLRPLAALSPARHQALEDPFASRLLVNRRSAKLPQLLGAAQIGPITDRSGPEHPNLVLHKANWNDKEDTLGVQEVTDNWKASTLKTNLQVRGSFGHYRPSIAPLLNGMIRINPGLYPLSLLQFGLMFATQAPGPFPKIDSARDFIHRDALNVAVNHALAVIAADRPGKSEKIHRIKTFAKHNLMINLLKAQTILKAQKPDPAEYMPYILWLEKDFSKTAQVLENLNESTHLLLSARVNEEKPRRLAEEPLLLRPGPFRQFVEGTFARGGRQCQIYYVASGMQAITTGAIAAVDYRRATSRTAAGKETGKAAGFVPLHPYFEMKDATARAAGFDARLPAETIISDLSPLDTAATVEQQSKASIRTRLRTEVDKDKTLVPVLDATAMPLAEVPSMVPADAENFIIVESLTKYAQLGSDKALGGRIIVVGTEDFIGLTYKIISPVEQSADIVVSRIWFESMENIRYSH
ncbi:eCIS core domain-containing protein [Pedobacter nutrimenti]|uniref:Uncharacterized protein DUF4157 n=1 Tax=Pedobacter nutrimenti TaxID=1241337 RepID=A0A318UKE8_9SPHI|nr:DUF4157 domain-containing protein [Pedobacter nutrimenti]PYF68828.1 uncharacterized protein DUF4157 [Pedobacter nutrimenti]